MKNLRPGKKVRVPKRFGCEDRELLRNRHFEFWTLPDVQCSEVFSDHLAFLVVFFFGGLPNAMLNNIFFGCEAKHLKKTRFTWGTSLQSTFFAVK